MSEPPTAPLQVYIIAGEASGDKLGAGLMQALRKAWGMDVSFTGVGGELMQEEGLQSLFPITELSLMGLAEVLPHIPRLRRRILETVKDIQSQKPDIVVTIDSPGFCFRVGRRLKPGSIPIVHYVAPSVWAWKPSRAKKVSVFLDGLLTLLPFEPPYFE
ncbi:MAG: lipid-A-disaccharide synthase, partial [Rhodospirillaceae bacterium]